MELYPGRVLARDSDPITADDLAGVILDGWQHRRVDGSVLGAWSRATLTLLLAEFECEWDDSWGYTELKQRRLPILLSVVPPRYSAIREPADGILEYPPLPGEMAALKPHLSGIAEQTASLRAAWRRLFRDLLVLGYPDLPSRNSTVGQLRQAGLEDPPDVDLLF